jgi:FAD/FMN-containing dehydrogenase
VVEDEKSRVGTRTVETRRDFIKRSASAGAAFALSAAWGRSAVAATPVVDPALAKKFGGTLKGRLLLPDDPSYDSARHIVFWNAKTAKHPAMIAQCADAEDVTRSVEFARHHDLLVAVRSGGHSTLGWSLCESGMVIDVRPIKQTRFDPVRRTVQAGAGLTNGELAAAASQYGLAPVLGQGCPTVGVSGLTLGGGLGDLSGRYGAVCDNLLSADLATADAQSVTTSATQSSDLFWAIRGGGGNFGIATSFVYQLHPVTEVLHANIEYRFTDARDVLRRFRDFMAGAPDELQASAVLSGLKDRSIRVGVFYSGDLDKGETVIRPLRKLATPVRDTVQRKSYLDTVKGSGDDDKHDSGFIAGKYTYLEQLSDEAIEAVLAQFAQPSQVECGIGLDHYMHGAVCRVLPDATAFELRKPGALHVWIATGWHDPKIGDASVQWVHGAWAALQPFSGGRIYANYLSVEGEDAVRGAFGKNYSKLVAIKNKYDPNNFFKLNPNIRPRPS